MLKVPNAKILCNLLSYAKTHAGLSKQSCALMEKYFVVENFANDLETSSWLPSEGYNTVVKDLPDLR